MKRVTLRMSDKLWDKLDELREETDVNTIAAVLRDSVCIYDWVLKQIRNGNQILVVSKEEVQEGQAKVVMPRLEMFRNRQGKHDNSSS